MAEQEKDSFGDLIRNTILPLLKDLPIIGGIVTAFAGENGDGLIGMIKNWLASMLPAPLAQMLIPGYKAPEQTLTAAQRKDNADAELAEMRLAQAKADQAAGRRIGGEFAASVSGPPAATPVSENRQAFGSAVTPPPAATTPPPGTPATIPGAPAATPVATTR